MQTQTPENIIVIPEDKIVDFIDSTLRRDTPEEYVRQNIEKRLVNELGYPRERISVEQGLKVGSAKPRADIVIYLKDKACDQENIYIVVECKKESISPLDRREGIGQLKSYMSSCLNCEWGLWTNGKQREAWRRIRNQDGSQEFIEVNDIPAVNGSLDDIDRPKRNTLKDAFGDNLLYAFKSAHNTIHVIDGFQTEQAFFELLKIIFCKIYDERNLPHPLEFYVTSSERTTADGQLACKNRISKIFDEVKGRYNQIFDKNDEIKLNSRSLVRVVAEFQGYSFLNTDVDIKGRAYEEVVGSNLKGDRGQFFTPRNVMHMAVSMINPSVDARILDPACGTGGFLVTAMNQELNILQKAWESETGHTKSQWSNEDRRAFMERVAEIAHRQFFGFDISPELAKATKMNMVMNNDGSGNIFQTDSLLPPHEWSEEFKAGLAHGLNIDPSVLTNERSLSYFDVVVTNPPFGSKIVIRDRSVLSQYDLGYIWEKPKKTDEIWTKTNRLQGGVPPEQLFIERCLQFLKPGGHLAIVLPDSILGSPGLGYIRQWILGEAKVIASIDLHADTFQPHTGVQTSVLILQKKSDDERFREAVSGPLPYNVFMAVVNKVGHDKRGNVIFKRDKYGNEILITEQQDIWQGENHIVSETKVKIIDDETPEVVSKFNEWKKTEGLV